MRVESGWCRGIRHCVSPHFNQRPLGEVSLLVIHNISLPAGCFGQPFIEQLFLGCLDTQADPSFTPLQDLQVSAHFLIGRDGACTQFVSCNDRAWHAGESCYAGRENCNDFAIGIELEGTDNTPFTAAQYQALKELTLVLFVAYPLLNSERIVGHCDIAPMRKTDPGPAFDWRRYLTSLKES